MPHKCVKCGETYPDGSAELLKGCSKCGGRFFFFLKKEKLEAAEQVVKSLTEEEKTQMEHDVKEIIGSELDEESPIVFDFENVSVEGPGKYHLDLVELFRGKPLVYKIEDGKYIIDIASIPKKKKK